MLVLRKRSFVIILTLISCLIAFIICVNSLGLSALSDTAVNKPKIVLDAGHGGIDGGVTGISSGVKESELNLILVKKLEKLLTSAGFNVVLTRSSDAGLYGVASGNLKRKDMLKRKEIINNAKPDLVVSIHLNKFSVSSRRGAQVFFREDSPEGKRLAISIQSYFNALEEATRSFDALKGDYYILNCSPYPSVIAECGFLSNPEEEKLLLTDSYQDKIVDAIFQGITTFLLQSAT